MLKVVLILGMIAGMAVLVNLNSSVSADKDGLEASSDLAAKIHLGKSGVGENSSSDANMTTHEDTSSKASSSISASAAAESSDKSHEDNPSGSSTSHGHYGDGYEKISVSSDDEFTAQSERHLYKPGDNVTIEGSLWPSLMSSLGNVTTVSIQVADNGGNVVYSGKGQINANDEFSAGFVLPNDAKQGAYTVNVSADVNTDVLGTLSLKAKDGLASSTKIVVANPNALKVSSEGKDYDVEVASNSTTVNNLSFDGQNKKLSFTVQGKTGTRGVTQITIPKSLLSGDMTVMIDGQAMAQSDVIRTVDTDTETTLEINYHHSTHQIDIVGTSAVPEFSYLAPVVLLLSVISVVVLARNLPQMHI